MLKKSGILDDINERDLHFSGDAHFVRPHWMRARKYCCPVGETQTQQSMKDQTDINNIVNRYQRTGQLPPARMEPQYADVSDLNKPLQDLHSDAQSTLAKVREYEVKKASKEAADKAAKDVADKAAKDAADKAAGAAAESQQDKL